MVASQVILQNQLCRTFLIIKEKSAKTDEGSLSRLKMDMEAILSRD